MSSILVLIEHRKDEIREVSFEMLNLAYKIGKKNDIPIYALLLEGKDNKLLEVLKPLCDKIIKISNPALTNYSPDPYIEAIEHVLNRISPSIIMIAHSAFGMDLAPGLAERLSIPLITDCVNVEFKENRLIVLRQIFGGKIYSELFIKPYNTYLVTIRPGTFGIYQESNKSAEIIEISIPEFKKSKGRKFLEYLEEKVEDVDITAADILVSIGRGIGKPENIPIVEEFAKEIGAVLCCSRPVADKGWLPKSRQVGTSGKIVKPKVYIALGISGAFQHQMGMKNSQTIIAINKDPKAPIFNVADYGIVGDMFQVLPILKEKLNKNG